MSNQTVLHKLITCTIATVWLLNGLFCKVLNWVPRHQLIVARILGEDYASVLTRLIGCFEVLLAIWIASFRWSRLSAIVQILLVATMNIIELVLAPDLLLFGKWNALNALLFIGVVYVNEFFLTPKNARQN